MTDSADRRTPKGEKMRARILEVAARRFAEQGYRGTSTAAIAKEVGVTNQGLLHYFSSKAELLVALLDSGDDFEDAYFPADGHVATEGVFPSLGRLAKEVERRPDLVRLYAVLLAESLDAGHPGHSYYIERFKRLRSLLTLHIEDERDAGSVGGGAPASVLSTILLATMDGLQYQWILDPSIDFGATYTTFLELIGAGLSAPTRAQT